jgi:hypothetical protein
MIDSFLQTDGRLVATVRKWGCALLSSLWHSSILWAPHQVNILFDYLLQHGLVDAECTILDWNKLLPAIDPHFSFERKEGYGYVTGEGEREVLKYHLSNINEDHFVAGNGKSMILWDSMNRLDIIEKYGSFKEKVIIRVS